MINLGKDMEFEFEAGKLVGGFRGIFEGKRLINQWSSKETLEGAEVAEVTQILTKVKREFKSFADVERVADEHYGYEVDSVAEGYNHHVDLFGSSERFNVWVRVLPQVGEYCLYTKIYRQ